MKINTLILASVFFAAFSPTSAQEVDNYRRLKISLRNGSVYHGTMGYDDGREMRFTTDEFGLLIIKKNELRRLDVIDVPNEVKASTLDSMDVVQYNATFKEGPFSTRYGLTTNALPIKKGENYGMASLVGPEIHFAITDRFNVGYMTTWASSPMAISVKYSLPSKSKNVHFSLGSLAMSSGFIQKFKGYGNLSFFNATFGTRAQNFTISLGYLYWKSGRKTLAPGIYSGKVDSSPIAEYSSFEASYLGPRDGNGVFSTIRSNVPEDKIRTASVTQGPVISIGGTFPLGEKASLVIESIVGVVHGEHEKIKSYLKDVQLNVNPLSGYTWYNKTYEYQVSIEKFDATIIFLNPGIRFQSTPNFAWQFSIASTAISRSFTATPITLPLPMFTLFKKF